MIRFSFIFLSICLISPVIKSQVFSERDIEICNSKFQFAVDETLDQKPIGDVIVEIGKSFIGTDYKAQAIEKDGEEQLVIDLTGLDCTTFLENALVFSRLIKEGKTTFEDYQKELTKIRYRCGVIDHYPSRLHYFSDWIFDNESKGIVEDVTEEIDGVPVKFNINFMSTHPELYKHLKENPEFIPIISEQEKKINDREYYYLPKENLVFGEDEIENGDLLALTTTVDGLDVGHVGIAIKMDDGKIHLLHAPTENTKVQISEKPLSEYLMTFKRHSGVIVLRPQEP